MLQEQKAGRGIMKATMPCECRPLLWQEAALWITSPPPRGYESPICKLWPHPPPTPSEGHMVMTMSTSCQPQETRGTSVGSTTPREGSEVTSLAIPPSQCDWEGDTLPPGHYGMPPWLCPTNSMLGWGNPEPNFTSPAPFVTKAVSLRSGLMRHFQTVHTHSQLFYPTPC